mmetsp:Transcript_79304/g.222607  ORF Transcript_79304/g.222607 Transcript_79304/m.222607 type:complete len:287 (+) Transcript_79304:901-1761(+)
MVQAVQEPDAVDGLLRNHHCELALQAWTQRVHHSLLVHFALEQPGFLEVVSQSSSHVLGQIVVRHHDVQQVHVLLILHQQGVHGRNDTADGTDDVRPDETTSDEAEDGEAILGEIFGNDVAVAQGRQSHHGPIQADEVDAMWLRVERLLLLREHLRDEEAVEPRARFWLLVTLLQGKQPPHAAHPMHCQHCNEEKPHQRDLAVRHAPGRLPLLDDAADLHESEEPDQAHDLHVLRILVAECRGHVHDEVEGHDGEQVAPKPSLDVVRDDLGAVPDPARGAFPLLRE